MDKNSVTRAQLKNAVDASQWDLLDKLLEISTAHIDDTSFYTDSWGEWWGLLLECVQRNAEKGVRILLKHGADKSIGNWGDCIPTIPLEAAANKPRILALLQADERPTYERQSEPTLPKLESAEDHAINQQGAVRDHTGMVFQTDAFKKSS